MNADPLILAMMAISDRLQREEVDVFAAYERFVAILRQQHAGSGAPRVGSKLPEFVLTDSDGEVISSRELIKRGPLVLSFFRGGWCDYCATELQILTLALPQIVEAGGHLVAVSAEVGGLAAQNKAKMRIPFPLLIDIDFGVAMSFGLLVPVPSEIQALHREWGVDFAQIYGFEGQFLPIPATFVVATDGSIAEAHVDPDFRRRMPIEVMLDSLKRLRASDGQPS